MSGMVIVFEEDAAAAMELVQELAEAAKQTQDENTVDEKAALIAAVLLGWSITDPA